jgi:hypothetical protein
MTEDSALEKKNTVAKSKEVKSGWSKTYLAESFKDGYGSKRAVLPMMIMMMIIIIIQN